MVAAERLIINNMDLNVLAYFIGYFYARDQERISQMMANSFPTLAAASESIGE